MNRRGIARAVVAMLAAVVGLTGCGFHGIYSLPLPGAVGNGGNTFTVNVQFADVLDLVPYSTVKVNGATVGHVKSISIEGRHALVACLVLDTVHLPANTVARVEQTSVLGEKFVELERPVGTPSTGRLSNGDVITLDRTDTDVSVEEVLGALSMLLNGGGVSQLHTITHELSTALSGRTGVSRDLLHNLNVFVAGLDDQKAAIIRALEGINGLTRTVRQQESSLVHALDRVPAAVKILADDRRRLTTMLVSVQHLGDVAAHVANTSHADLVANLRHLRPTLTRLAKVGKVIPEILGVLITYPTADSVENEYFGDYGNLSLTLDVSAKSLLDTFGPKTGVTPHGAHRSATIRRAPGRTVEDLLFGALR
jgi:phospholipid/cholesterol/gamma-HCH transport system substrate-binding protein